MLRYLTNGAFNRLHFRNVGIRDSSGLAKVLDE